MRLAWRIVRRLAPGLYARVEESTRQLNWLWLSHSDRRFLDHYHRKEFMRRAFFALSFNGIQGDYAEFGCAGGFTFHAAYEESRKIDFRCKLWAFDSFSGLPAQAGPEDAHPRWQEGGLQMSLDAFLLTCHRKSIPKSDFEVVAGFYVDTLAETRNGLPDDLALVYIDCDLYSSTKTVLEFLTPRLKHGMIIAFDDYYCYSDTALSGERRAFLEQVQGESRFRFSPFVQFGWHGMSFVVENAELYRGLDAAVHWPY